MKKIFMSLIFILFLIPTVVFAEEKIEIKSITFVEKSENTKINTEASTDGEKINIDLTFYDKDDYATYKVVIKNPNNVSLYINDKMFNDDKEYISYEFDSNFIKAKEEKTINLKVSYKKEVPSKLFRSAKYDASSNGPLILSDKTIGVPNTLKNLGILGICILIISSFCIATGFYLIYKNKKGVGVNVLIISLLLILVPNTVSALLQIEVPIDSKIIINKSKENSCTYEGDLVDGTTYINGQYTYRYKMKMAGSGWASTTSDGWGVVLTDTSSTDPVTTKLCTVINNKPVVSMSYMFAGSHTTSIDLSSFNTSNVTTMEYMFAGVSGVEEYDLSTFDTSNNEYFNFMFVGNTGIKELNLSGFDTSKAINIIYIAKGCSNLEYIDLSYLSFKSIRNDMAPLLSGDNSLKETIMDNWDLTDATINMNNNIKNILLEFTTEKLSLKNWVIPQSLSGDYYGLLKVNSSIVDVTDWDLSSTVTFDNIFRGNNNIHKVIGLSSWDVSNLEYFSGLFYECKGLEEIEIEGWNLEKAKTIDYLFYGIGKNAENIKVYIKDFNAPVATSGRMLFPYIGGGNTQTVDVYVNNMNLPSITDANMMFGCLGQNSKNVKVIVDGFNIDSEDEIYETFYYIGSSSDKVEVKVNNLSAASATNAQYVFRYTGGNAKVADIKMTNWSTPSLTSAAYMFDYFAYGAQDLTFELDTWDTSNVTNMALLFYTVGRDSKKVKFKIDNIDTSKVTNMYSMFNWGFEQAIVEFDGLDKFDTSSVTNLNGFMYTSGNFNPNGVKDLGTLNIKHSADISSLFSDNKNAKVVINLYENPTSYNRAFQNAALLPGSEIIVNYTSRVTDIDNIIATKSENSNVIKGELIED